MPGAPTEATAPIVKTIDINAPRGTVETFVARFGAKWPCDRFARGARVPGAVVLEAHAGGAIFEVADSGDRLDWGTVVSIEPDRLIRMRWHLGRPSRRWSRSPSRTSGRAGRA